MRDYVLYLCVGLLTLLAPAIVMVVYYGVIVLKSVSNRIKQQYCIHEFNESEVRNTKKDPRCVHCNIPLSEARKM